MFKCKSDCFGKTAVIFFSDIFNQIYENFRVSTALELVAVLDEGVLQYAEVFDDSVVNQSNLAGLGIMGMGIAVARFTMSCPAGMGDSDVDGLIFSIKEFLKRGYFSLAFVNIQIAVFVDDCHSGTVIATVLKSFESLKQNRACFTIPYITYDSTHFNII